MGGLPEPDWYLDNVLIHAEPRGGGRIEVGPAALWRAWWDRQGRGSTDPAVILAGRQGFVAGLNQLHELGWLRHDLRRELRRGNWTQVTRGVHTCIDVHSDTADAPTIRRRTHALASAAAALARSGHGVSGVSAAVLHGLPTLEVPHLPELTAGDAALGRRSRAHVFGAGLTDPEVTSWFGTPVTTVARTLADLGRHDRRDAIMACDAALREGLVDRVAIIGALARSTGWPGVRQARDVLALGDPRAESPLESLLRLALHDDGFPPPQLQVRIEDPARGTWYRVDLLYPDARLIIEADGRAKYADDELWREKRRETRLRALGYRVERVTWADVHSYWPDTSRWLRGMVHL